MNMPLPPSLQPTLRPVVSGSMLKRHGRDLTQDAADGRLDPLIGRQDVIERALQVGGLGWRLATLATPYAICFRNSVELIDDCSIIILL